MPHFGEQVPGIPLAGVGITLTGSPFTYVNTRPGVILVNGGTVTVVEIGRGGTFYVTGVIAGAFPVGKSDSIRITYTVAPTMTLLPA